MAGARRPTIADVARRAVVDPSVVSKVLSGDPSLQVRDQTRERVRQAAADLGYVPNYNAQRLRSGARAIGLLVPEYRNPGNAEIISGAEEAATARGMPLWTASTDGQEQRRYLDLFRSGIVDALLIAGDRTDQELAELAASGPAVLLVNHQSASIDRWLVLEDERAAMLATERLLSAGHRRIGFIGGRSDHSFWADHRRVGYLEAFERARVPADPRMCVVAELTPEGGAMAAAQLLSATPQVTALVVSHGLMCLGAWGEVRSRGLRVPGDVSLVGIARLPFEHLREPALTRVDLPLRSLGARAVELVLDTPSTASIREVFTGPMSLVEGDTVAPPGTS